MRILAVRPAPPGAGSTIARVDVEINEDVRFFGLRLTRRPDGRRGIYAPNAAGHRIATFSYSLAAKIAAAAEAALEELKPYDQQRQ